MASLGFIELLRLADLAKSRATGRHDADYTQWIGIAFEVGGQEFVAPMGEVSEILALPELTPIPRTKPWLLGVANVRGRLLPLADLAKFLNIDSRERLKDKKVMVIDQDGFFQAFWWIKLRAWYSFQAVNTKMCPCQKIRLLLHTITVDLSKIIRHGMWSCRLCCSMMQSI